MASTFILKRKLFYTNLGHGQTGLNAGENRAMDFTKRSASVGKAGESLNGKLTATAEKAYQRLFRPDTELSLPTTKPVSTGNQSVRRLEGFDSKGRQVWNETAVTDLTPDKKTAAQQRKQIQSTQKQNRKSYNNQVKQDKARFANTIKQNKANLQHQQAMRAKAANNVGVMQGMKNTWGRMGTVGKVGTAAAVVGTGYLAGKGLGLWGKSDKK